MGGAIAPRDSGRTPWPPARDGEAVRLTVPRARLALDRGRTSGPHSRVDHRAGVVGESVAESLRDPTESGRSDLAGRCDRCNLRHEHGSLGIASFREVAGVSEPPAWVTRHPTVGMKCGRSPLRPTCVCLQDRRARRQEAPRSLREGGDDRVPARERATGARTLRLGRVGDRGRSVRAATAGSPRALRRLLRTGLRPLPLRRAPP